MKFASVTTAGANGVVCIWNERCGVRDLAVVCVTAERAACANGGASGRAYATVHSPFWVPLRAPPHGRLRDFPPSLYSARAGGGLQPPPLAPPPISRPPEGGLSAGPWTAALTVCGREALSLRGRRETRSAPPPLVVDG